MKRAADMLACKSSCCKCHGDGSASCRNAQPAAVMQAGRALQELGDAARGLDSWHS